MQIRLATKNDLDKLAAIFTAAFTQADPSKPWGSMQSLALMQYWLKRQPDLFFVATEGEGLLGGMVANIKPWRDGNRCQDGIIFVDPAQQNKGIGRALFVSLLTACIEKYQTKTMEGITFSGSEFPLSWYERIGLKKDEGAIVIKGDCKEILTNLTVQ